MFIHLGNDNVIRSEDVVSIIDYSIVKSSSIMEDMVKKKADQQQIYGPADEAKSVVVTRDTIYYSSLSVPTLKKRSSMSSMISKLDDYSDDIE
ncbi:hypothetical protein GCM10028778_00930 [Barrientosiimonas marina]|uniref:Extracellular matrix regulator RemB n=1 Tax=Lentibacillus kimchii TaxID=1542911 RepID=A0ABW2UV73_9BACI